MTKSELEQSIKDNPFNKYVDHRTNELMRLFLKDCKSKDHTAWLKFVGSIIQLLSVNEADIMENQSALNNGTTHRASRDYMLNVFGKMFIKDVIAKHNRTYSNFDKSYLNVKGGDDQ